MFTGVLAGGIVAELLLKPPLKPPLYGDAHAIGVHTIGLLVPFVGAIGFTFAACVLDQFDGRGMAATLGLFVLLCLPFADLFAAPIVYLADDARDYSLYAHNILEEHTLWGSDDLVYSVRYYVDQPGYRYYLAAAIGLLGGEHRGMQLFNLAVLLLTTLTLLRTLQTRVDRPWFVAFACFLLGSAPYAAKNVLMGMTEWFAVLMFMLFIIHHVRGRALTAVIFLALVPFVRQNLLIVSLILAGVIALTPGRRWLLVPFSAALGLPIYHNLYYAGVLRFLVANRGWTGGVEVVSGPQSDPFSLVSMVWSKMPLYLGYYPGQELLTLAIAVIFAPFGTGLVAWLIIATRGWHRWLFAAVAAAAILPTTIMGGLYYPRFVYVNLSLILMTCLTFSNGFLPPWPGRSQGSPA